MHSGEFSKGGPRTNPLSPKKKTAQRHQKSGQHGSPSNENKLRPAIKSQTARTSQMTQKYKVKEKLGRGAFATVRRCIRKKDGCEFALKVVRKKGMEEYNLKALESETKIMSIVEHPNIVRLYELYNTPNHLHMIIDLLAGGELFDRIVEQGTFTEYKSARIVSQIAEALNYLHEKDIVHRDLKPENLLYQYAADDKNVNEDDRDIIKLVDFGLAKQQDKALKTPCGSPAYVAPEVLKRQPYSKEVDWWSLGVILYILLCGFPPFHDEENDLKKLYKKIKGGQYSFPSPYWDNISSDAKDLVSKLLTVNPKKRANYKEVVSHSWLKNKLTNTINVNRLRNFQYTKTLRRGVNTVLAVLRLIDLLNEQTRKSIQTKRKTK